jgi:hypothetical protein
MCSLSFRVPTFYDDTDTKRKTASDPSSYLCVFAPLRENYSHAKAQRRKVRTQNLHTLKYDHRAARGGFGEEGQFVILVKLNGHSFLRRRATARLSSSRRQPTVIIGDN